ncbi:MAG: fibrobacter succinogenes major paralogous domain-containing protein [Bacteroidales bacterium]|nr:fibrobacter succinogenes major paralogous domain-containing protein [Bacteroidales bacterium]
MKKTLLTIIFSMLIVLTSLAQSEPKMNYQAVLRDSQNKLVANTPVQVTLTVQNRAGVTYYTEPKSTITTNQNGLMTLAFGGGTNWNTVNWEDANLVIDVTWGEGNSIKDTVATTAVPYAYYAANVPTCEDMKACINDTLEKYTTTDQLCNVINTCDMSSNIYIQNLLQNLSNRIDEQNEIIGQLNRALDSVSQLIPFVCGASLAVDHEGNKYRTVEITTTSGTKQCWLAENMRCTTAPAESGVTLLAGGYIATDYSTPRYLPAGAEMPVGMDSATYVNTYGCLYNFPAAMAINTKQTSFQENYRGICPEGWHIPTLEEFNTLKGTSGWNSSTAFNPLRAGYFNQYHPNIADTGVGFYFWSTTVGEGAYAPNNAFALYSENGTTSKLEHFFRSTVFSVRCLRNN